MSCPVGLRFKTSCGIATYAALLGLFELTLTAWHFHSKIPFPTCVATFLSSNVDPKYATTNFLAPIFGERQLTQQEDYIVWGAIAVLAVTRLVFAAAPLDNTLVKYNRILTLAECAAWFVPTYMHVIAKRATLPMQTLVMAGFAYFLVVVNAATFANYAADRLSMVVRSDSESQARFEKNSALFRATKMGKSGAQISTGCLKTYQQNNKAAAAASSTPAAAKSASASPAASAAKRKASPKKRATSTKKRSASSKKRK